MATEAENIQGLSHAVMTEARSEAEHRIVEARQKAEEIRSKAQEQAAAERAKILENANKEAARMKSQMVASAHLKARTVQLEQREQVLNHVFEQAMRQLPEIQKNGEYKAIAAALLKESLERLGSDSAVIQADERTRSVLSPETLASISKESGVQLSLAEPLTQGTGLVVETPDGHRRYDNTLETRMGRLQDSLRNPVYRLLMGETV